MLKKSTPSEARREILCLNLFKIEQNSGRFGKVLANLGRFASNSGRFGENRGDCQFGKIRGVTTLYFCGSDSAPKCRVAFGFGFGSSLGSGSSHMRILLFLSFKGGSNQN